MTNTEQKALKKFSAQLRIDQLEMFKQRGMGHIGGCLSVTELISVLYGKQMKFDPKNPSWEGRDYLVMSKAHAAPTVCAALAEKGFFDKKLLLTMDDIGTHIPSHVDRLLTPGVDMTGGSLGQGCSVAAGIAFGLRHMGRDDQYVYVCIGDGELNEGQNWEAFQFLAHYKLNNCIVFIDNNKRQHDGYCTEVLNPFSYEDKMRAFGFWTITVDGGDEEAIDDAINLAKKVKDQAVCIVLDTIKGQGVKYYEDMPDNHAPKVFEEGKAVIDAAIAELKKITEGE
ncbi:transketolase [Youxingia wuxianensis]|uniref:Transketolase n=1 Tax=Youxingia wuxianensis TaxID=2763678 RepID=A0A926ER47_9FIRM|nr:transketolase [Youxingia wuxianensis]MBC8584770.1 transketolase [Youxingia wuxianensis]